MKGKRFLAVLMAALCAALILVPAVPAQAATSSVYIEEYTDANGKTKSFTKGTGTVFSEGSFSVNEHGGNHAIKNLKANKKGIKLAVTNTNYGTRYDSASDSDLPFRESTIRYYATKTGTYKITFKVNSKQYTYNLKIYASSNRAAKVTFGKQVVRDYSRTANASGYTYKAKVKSKVTGKSGKLTVKPTGPYKITGLVAETYNKKGNPVYTKLKNGGKLTLSKGYDKYISDDKTYSYSSPLKYTYIYISYKNTFTGESVTYSVGKNPDTGEKCIIRTTKDRYGTNKSYYVGGGSDIVLWQY